MRQKRNAYGVVVVGKAAGSRPRGRLARRREKIVLKKQDERRRADRTGDGGDKWRAAVTTVVKIWFHKIRNIRIS